MYIINNKLGWLTSVKLYLIIKIKNNKIDFGKSGQNLNVDIIHRYIYYFIFLIDFLYYILVDLW